MTKSSVGVIFQKVVGNRYMEKRVNLRIEHVKHSKCRQEFLQRVKDNQAKKLQARETGKQVSLKREPVQPKGPRYVSTASNKPITITPVPYEALV